VERKKGPTDSPQTTSWGSLQLGESTGPIGKNIRCSEFGKGKALRRYLMEERGKQPTEAKGITYSEFDSMQKPKRAKLEAKVSTSLGAREENNNNTGGRKERGREVRSPKKEGSNFLSSLFVLRSLGRLDFLVGICPRGGQREGKKKEPAWDDEHVPPLFLHWEIKPLRTNVVFGRKPFDEGKASIVVASGD